jgi:Anaphase-promoting complex subunit 5
VQALVHMLIDVRGYLEVYHRELETRLNICSQADSDAADARFATTRTLRPAAQLSTHLAHHADVVTQLSAKLPLAVMSRDLAAVAAQAPSLPVAHAAIAHTAALSKCAPPRRAGCFRPRHGGHASRRHDHAWQSRPPAMALSPAAWRSCIAPSRACIVAPTGDSSPACRTYNAALAALLHLHDCMVPASAAQPATTATAPPLLPPDRRSRPLQQALLSLSELHVQHGHVDAATTALLEAVDVDQGSGDVHALLMCLLQLCVIMRASTPFHSAEAQSPASLMQVRKAQQALLAAQVQAWVRKTPQASLAAQRQACLQQGNGARQPGCCS